MNHDKRIITDKMLETIASFKNILDLKSMRFKMISILLSPGGTGMGNSGAVSAVWLGTAGLYVKDGRTSFFIDPYVSRVSAFSVFAGRPISPDTSRVETCINRVNAEKAEAVIVGHSHFDHLMDAPEFARKTGAVIVGSQSTAKAARGAGLAEDRIRVIKSGDSIDIGDFSIKFIEGVHGPAFLGRIPYPGSIEKPFAPPAKASDYRLGTFFGMAVSHPHGTFIHHGSAGWIEGMYGGVNAETVFLCLAGRKDTKRYVEETILKTKAKTVIPIHYDNFFSVLEEPLGLLPGIRTDEFIKTMMNEAPNVEVKFAPLMKGIVVF